MSTTDVDVPVPGRRRGHRRGAAPPRTSSPIDYKSLSGMMGADRGTRGGRCDPGFEVSGVVTAVGVDASGPAGVYRGRRRGDRLPGLRVRRLEVRQVSVVVLQVTEREHEPRPELPTSPAVSSWRQVVVETSSPGAHAMSPAATTPDPAQRIEAGGRRAGPGRRRRRRGRRGRSVAAAAPSLPPPPSLGLHATTSDNVATDTSAPILLRLPTPVNVITPP